MTAVLVHRTARLQGLVASVACKQLFEKLRPAVKKRRSLPDFPSGSLQYRNIFGGLSSHVQFHGVKNEGGGDYDVDSFS